MQGTKYDGKFPPIIDQAKAEVTNQILNKKIQDFGPSSLSETLLTIAVSSIRFWISIFSCHRFGPRACTDFEITFRHLVGLPEWGIGPSQGLWLHRKPLT
jgi:hypothetical protein